ncbi:lamin tail domain-containing protein [Verrucomicrobiota bacterium sgz303538]
MFPQFLSRRVLLSVVIAVCILTGQRADAAADSVVVFNEVQYAPPAGGTEWVELHSLHGVNVDISGWKITGGIKFTFPAGTTIPGHGFLVVAATPGAIPGALGPFTGALNNSGDTIQLVNKNGRVMDELSYSDSGKWPVGPDGSGATLVKVNQETADASSAQWTTSPNLGGSAGVTNFPIPGQPVVTTPATLTGSWKYLDTGVAPAAGWNTEAFDDSAWSSGTALLYAGSPDISGAGEGLYGYWKFDETSGTTAANSATGGTAGTLNGGTTFVADATRTRVLNCSGASGAYVDAGVLPQMTLANDFTWSFWANSVTSGGSTVVLGNRYSPSGVDFSPREFTKFTPTAFEYHRNTAGENIGYTTFPTNSWVHHAVVKKGTSYTYYRNGVLSGSVTATLGQNNPQPFYFGGDKAGENWAGKLDDVAVWTKALPASSISGLANNSLTPLTAPTGSSSAALSTAITAGPSTHYFRKSFTFNGAKERTTLTLQHMLDDGAVFYLNGIEVLRVNMPAGAVTHTTPASTNITSTSLSGSITIPSDALVRGTNVLAVEVHQFSTSSPNNDLVFGASLTATEAPGPARYPGSGLVFNEISAGGAGFQLELLNNGTSAIDLAGYKIVSSSGASATLSSQLVAAGGVAVVTSAQLGFTPLSGDRLFLIQPDGSSFEDAQRVTGKLRGRAPDGRWLFPNTASFGGSNIFAFNTSVIINEIMHSPLPGQAAQEKWVELYNRGTTAVDLSGWKFSDGISYTFPAGTALGAGQYLVITNDTAAFAQHHPGVTALGPFSGKLSSKSDHLELTDAVGNPVDEVRYAGGGRWAANAGGGGSSLERRDVRADSNAPEAWAGSDETARGSWQTFTWTGAAANLNGDPTQWNEFICGLLDTGTFLIDDISVKDVTAGNVELIQNGGFESGATTGWRLLGTHRNATVINDPGGSGKVLQVAASGATEHMHNHLETTLKNGASYVTIDATHTYTISFRARWVSGSNKLNVRLYFNRLAKTVTLPVTSGGGTPGAANSRTVANIGPTYANPIHSPAVPSPGQAVTVSAIVSDPDNIGAVALFYSINGAAFTSTPMTLQGGKYSGTIPGQTAGAKAQFYVQATDSLGAVANFPQGGASSRALVLWDDGQARLTLNGVAPNNVRVLMTNADTTFLHTATNVMSNDRLGCTVIYNESEIFYDCGVKLKGSERGRNQDTRVSFNIEFPEDHLFLGTHRTIAIDRSGAGNQTSQKEILIKHAIASAGGIPGSQDDLCRIIAPLSKHTGSAILVKERYDSAYLNNQYDNGSDGRMFKFEYIYYPYTTTGNSSSPGNTGAAVESLKYPEPDNVVTSVSVRNLGNDKELHRWHWLIQNNEEVDDYSGLMTWLSAFGRSSVADAQYFSDTAAMMDVDEWLRSFAVEMLFGIGDNYGGGDVYHNAIVYQRPTDGRWMFFPHDMDFTFANDVASAFNANSDLRKLIGTPANARAYYGHLQDLCNTAYNTAYLQPWAQHYSKFLSEDLTTYMSYIATRRSNALSAINAAVPQVSFSITTNGGQPLTVNSSFVTLQGRGWVNVREIRIAGTTQPLVLTWTNNNTWQVAVPVATGTQTVTLEAIGFDGTVIGTASITVTNTATNSWAPVRINEWLASNQSYLDPVDNSADDWIELYNPTAAPVSLASWSIADDNTTYTIPSGYSIPAGGFLIIWADNQTYQNTGSGQLHVPFQLGAGGDSITLRAPDAQLVDKVTFGTQRTDVSEGRYPDGADAWRTLTAPSPLARNVLTIPTVSRNGTVVTLTFSTTPGVRYQAEASSDLVNWLPIGAVQTANSDTLTVQEDAGISSRRFYRVQVDP